MNISRYNYEECFLLYVDNELTPAERGLVEAFVLQNPDLEEEFTMLKQSQLKPDASLVWEDKSVLFRSEKDQLIDLQNYETFFLLYVDNELNVGERRVVESFVSQHPALQQELDILMNARLTADSEIVFPNKQLLYRETAKVKVISIKVWRMVAVAAMLILAVGIFWLVSINDNATESAKKDGQQKDNSKEQLVQKKNEVDKNQSDAPLVAEADKKDVEVDQPKTLPGETKKVNPRFTKENESNKLANILKEESTEITDEPTIHPRLVARVDALEADVIGSSNVRKTIIIDQPYETSTEVIPEIDNGVETFGSTQPKSKLRGFFRQVSRVVEKTTNLPADKNKKLRIGNIEIALK